MTVPTSDQATRDARRMTLLGTAAVFWVLTWNVVGIWARRGDFPAQVPAAVLVLVESTVARSSGCWSYAGTRATSWAGCWWRTPQPWPSS